MTQGLNFPPAAGLPVTSRPETKPALQDVGRDRYFLNALQGIGADAGTPKATHATAPEYASPPSDRDITVAPSLAASPIEHVEQAMALPAHDAFATHTPGGTSRLAQIPKQATAIGNARFATTQVAITPTNINSTVGSAAQHVDNRPPAPWQPQNITLRDTGDGVDVIARNFYLDDTGRRQLAMRILQDLIACGKSPRQLTLNGEVIWRAESSAHHTQPTGRH